MSPMSFTIRVDPDTTNSNHALRIGNLGDGYLSYSLSCYQTAGLRQTASTETSSFMSRYSDDEMVIHYTFDSPVHSFENEYDILTIPHTEQFKQAGAPIIPVYPIQLLIPYGKSVNDVSINVSEQTSLNGVYHLSPTQASMLSDSLETTETTKDPSIYSSATAWPEKPFTIIGEQLKRGYRILLLNVYPLQYNPATGEALFNKTMTVRVELTEQRNTSILHPNNETKQFVSNHVHNQEVLATYPEQSTQLTQRNDRLSEIGDERYDYLIITSETALNAPAPYNFQRLRDHRIAQGYHAAIVTTEWIYDNYDGTRPDGDTDNQTKIRNFLIDAYRTWGTEYVLLGGSAEFIPPRMFYVDYKYMPVDMYYGMCRTPFNCTFDYNANGRYGEEHCDGTNGEDVDLYAEIYIGRAPVESYDDLANFVRKTLAYDSTTSDYLQNVMMLGEQIGFGRYTMYAKETLESTRWGFQPPSPSGILRL